MLLALYLTTILFALIRLNNGDYRTYKYIQKASKDAQRALQNILANQKLTKEQQRNEISEWAQMQGGEVEELYEKEEMEMEKIEALKPEMIRKSDMSEEGKKVALQLTALSNNMTITSEEEANEYEAIMSKLPPDVQEEVDNFMLSMMEPFKNV